MRVKELITEFAQSVEFSALSASTKGNYGRFLVYAQSSPIGDLDVKNIEKADILRLRDKLAKTPGSANNLLGALGSVFSFAISREYMTVNPVSGIKKLKLGEWKEWTTEEVMAAIEKTPPKIGLAIAIAYYTAQRQSDILDLCWDSADNGVIKFKQKKTGTSLEIPVDDRLKEIWSRVRGDENDDMIFKSGTKPMSSATFRKLYKLAIRKIGIDKPFHGLRKAACTNLAENGCSAAQIKAVSGHKTDAMVGKYTKAADQKRLAREAMKNITSQAPSSGA